MQAQGLGQGQVQAEGGPEARGRPEAGGQLPLPVQGLGTSAPVGDESPLAQAWPVGPGALSRCLAMLLPPGL